MMTSTWVRPNKAWVEEAYKLGLEGPGMLSPNTLHRILLDPSPTNWVKWWRRGLIDGLEQRRMKPHEC